VDLSHSRTSQRPIAIYENEADFAALIGLSRKL
jgi:hypothetical protein